MDNVILVDQHDAEIGTMEKMEAHRSGSLHRAFSVVIFNSEGQMLLQKRSRNKYHSGGLWTNACCSHPQPNEDTLEAAQRRLKEELGIDLLPDYSHKFIYRVSLDNDLIEHECDHVFIGRFDGDIEQNPDEIEDWKFMDLDELRADMVRNPDRYTYWFKLIMNQPELQGVLARN